MGNSFLRGSGIFYPGLANQSESPNHKLAGE